MWSIASSQISIYVITRNIVNCINIDNQCFIIKFGKFLLQQSIFTRTKKCPDIYRDIFNLFNQRYIKYSGYYQNFLVPYSLHLKK